MIDLAGSTHQTFLFPAEIPEALAYYSALVRSLGFLAHVKLVKVYDAARFRMLYHSLELGIYRVQIYCDVQAVLDQRQGVIQVLPLSSAPAFKARSSLYSLTARGEFTSRSEFRSHPSGTEIDYSLTLKAVLPVPLGARFMPDSVLAAIARSITHRRIQEIAGGYITRTVCDYRLNSIVQD